MIRKTLTTLSLLGLLLSVGLWGVSYLRFGFFLDSSNQYFVLISTGAFHCGYSPLPLHRVRVSWLPHETSLGYEYPMRESKKWWFNEYVPRPQVPLLRTLWLPRLGPEGWSNLSVPLWMPTAIFGFAACRPLNFHRRRKRKKLGLCVKCGYDLTGNITGTCSECGEAIR